MNYSEVKKELKKEFESFLKDIGYKSKSDSQGSKFILSNETQILEIGFGVSNFTNEFYTGFFSSIYLKEIQKIQEVIFNEEGNYTSLAYNSAIFFNDINYRYKVQTIDDIKNWGILIKEIYYNAIKPFFDKYNSVASLDELCNKNPKEKVIYCDDLYWRMMNGLISAKLNDNPKFNELKVYYRNEVEKIYAGNFKYDKCIKVFDFLEKNSMSELKKISKSAN